MSNISQTAMNDCLSTTSWSTFIPLIKVALSENHLEFKVFHFDGIPSSREWRPKLFHGNSKNYIFNVCTLLHTSDEWLSKPIQSLYNFQSSLTNPVLEFFHQKYRYHDDSKYLSHFFSSIIIYNFMGTEM